MSVHDLPSLLYELSQPETAVLLISALLGLISLPLLKRIKLSKVARAAVAGIAVILLLYGLSSILSGITTEQQAPRAGPLAVRNIVHTMANILNSFYSSQIGFLLGSAGLTVIKFTAAVFPIGIVYLLIRAGLSASKDRKRCSNCHYIFPARTQPHRHCPHCGAYWKYEK